MRMRRQGMTMIEVTTALTITAMIGLVASSVTFSMLKAQESADAYTENVQAGRVSLAQIQRLIRSSKLVTAGDPQRLVLWSHDQFNPGVIDRDELVFLRYSPDDGVVTMIRTSYPDSMTPQTRDALNAPLLLSDVTEVSLVDSGIANASYIETVDIACGLSSFAFRCDIPPPLTVAVSMKAVFGSGEQAVPLRTSAAIRASAVKWVEFNHNTPALTMPTTEIANDLDLHGGA